MDARRSELLKASPRMFDSDLLDKLSRVHPAVPVVIFLPEIVVLLALAIHAGAASALGLIRLFVGGFFFWRLMECRLHLVMFRFEREEGFGARLHWISHGVHHAHPNDPLRLV